MKTKHTTRTLLIGLTAALALFASGCELEETTSNDGTAADREAAEATEAPKGDKAPAKPKGPQLTPEQTQAVKSANDYLDYSAFSKSGLIDQLKSEGYSAKDARVAVNNIKVNWKNQAAKSANDYLDYTSFSRSGLIDQLKSEGYTQQQAEYGVSQTPIG